MEGLTAGVGYVFQVRPLFGNGGSNGWGWSAVSPPFTPMDSSDSTPASPAAGHQSFPSSSSAQHSRIPLFPANNWQPFYRMRNEGDDDPLSLSLADVLSEDAAESQQPAPRIEEIFLFNMVVSTSRAEKLRSWLGTRWGTHIGRVSVRVFCNKSDAGPKREGAFSSHPRLSITPIDVSDSTSAAEIFGHHHSKLCVVLYSTGVRLAVLTSNLRAAELDLMTNAMWVQDFPLKGAGGGGECEFEKDLCDYLSHIHVQGAEKDGARGKADKKDKKDKGSKKDKEDQRERERREARRAEAEADVDREPHPDQTPLIALIAALRRHDFSSAQVVLIPSVPGRHTSRHSSEHAHTASAHASAHASASAAPYCMESQGHVKLRAVLKKEARAPVGLGAAATLDLQCSSLGAQGKGDAFLNEVATSMHADSSAYIPLGAHGDLGRVNLLWPSVDTVRLSRGGFSSGDSIMAEGKVFEGEGVRKCLRNWVPAAAADKFFAPHIKTYYHHFVAADGQVELMWMYLGSHNLSQASWGHLEKANTQLHVKSYELGVLFLPSRTTRTSRLFSLTPAHPILGYQLGDKAEAGVAAQAPEAAAQPPRFLVSHLPSPRDGSWVHFPLPHKPGGAGYDLGSRDLAHTPWAQDLDVDECDSKGQKKSKQFYSRGGC